MKTRFAPRRLGAVLALGLLLTPSAFAQPILPPGGTNAHGTNSIDWTAYYSNNLASVAAWLHDCVTNADGTAATSFQGMMDAQVNAFSTAMAGDVWDWQQSVRDEALTWATAIGLPTEFAMPGGTKAYLVSREGGVPNYLVPFDLVGAITISTTNVWPGGPTGFGLTGTNTTISMWDEASPRLSHSELTNRVTVLDGVTTLSSHSTAVAGVMAATGANIIFTNGVSAGYAAKGMAYAAKVQARDFIGDMGEMIGAVGSNHMRLSNHSYGSVAGWFNSGGTWYWWGNPEISGTQDPKFGNYTTNASSYDVIVQNAPTFLSVWASGNALSNGPPVQPTNHVEFNLQGTGYFTNATRSRDGDAGGFDSLAQQACAKNILTVGAVNPLLNGYAGPTNLIFAPFSSCGPTDDGRIKPDVVADGVNNIVPIAGSDFDYASASGTSFAAPTVAGSVSLLTQFYKQLHTGSSELLASTVKGLVIHTADSGTTNGGPHYRAGWGLMNTRSAATLISRDATNGLKNHIKEVLLPNGQFIQFPIVSGGTNALKVTICWTDPAGTPNSVTNLDNPTSKLVNDLDLRVFAPNGTTNFPWILNPDLTNQTSSIRSAAATRGDDARNNVEQVYIPNPTNGIYTVKVAHKSNLQSNGTQWVSFVVSGNVPQQAPTFLLAQPVPTATNLIAVGWPSVVGQQYQLQRTNTIALTNGWLNVGGIISARLTNIVTQTPFSPTNNAFYRVVQIN